MSENASILQDLQSSGKTFRVIALEKIVQEGGTQEVLEALVRRQREEQDEECLVLLHYAIAATRRKLGLEATQARPRLTAGDFLRSYAQASEQERVAILENLDHQSIGDLASHAPVLLEGEPSPFAAALIIRLFINVWPREQLKALSARLFSPSLSVRWATLEALIKIAPGQLEKGLPRLLQSPDPRTRLLAIRGLMQIDMAEALAHLEALLLSGDGQSRMLAIQHSFSFPFADIKSIFLKFIAAENDATLLENACTLFEINPDIEAPFKLWELAETAPPAKAVLLKQTLKNSLLVLEASNLLGQKFPLYQQKLQNWLQKRMARSFVQEVIVRLNTGETTIDTETQAIITARLKLPLIRETVREALTWDLSPEVKTKLNSFLIPEDPAPTQPQRPAAVPPQTWESLTSESKIRLIASWEPEDKTTKAALLEGIFADDRSPPDLLAAALRAARKFEIRNVTQKAWGGTRQSDPNLVSAALEYLAMAVPEDLLLQLGKFLQSFNGRIKATAIRILQRFDCAQSLSTLKAMLSSRKNEQQLLALSCMVYFDISLLRQILTDFLETCSDPALIDPCVTLFLANPDQENLFPLLRLQKTGGALVVQATQKAFQENLNFLVQSGRIQQEEIAGLQKGLEQRWAIEAEKRQKPPAAYSVKSLSPGTFRDSPLAGELRDLAERWGLKGFVALCLVMSVILWMLVLPGTPEPEARKKDGVLLPVPITIEGSIAEKLTPADRLLIRSKDDKTYEVLANQPVFRAYQRGDTVKMQVLPYQILISGTMICYFTQFTAE